MKYIGELPSEMKEAIANNNLANRREDFMEDFKRGDYVVNYYSGIIRLDGATKGDKPDYTFCYRK